jgi:hypothetical protein
MTALEAEELAAVIAALNAYAEDDTPPAAPPMPAWRSAMRRESVTLFDE